MIHRRVTENSLLSLASASPWPVPRGQPHCRSFSEGRVCIMLHPTSTKPPFSATLTLYLATSTGSFDPDPAALRSITLTCTGGNRPMGFGLLGLMTEVTLITLLLSSLLSYTTQLQRRSLRQSQTSMALHWLEDSLRCAILHQGVPCTIPHLPEGWHRVYPYGRPCKTERASLNSYAFPTIRLRSLAEIESRQSFNPCVSFLSASTLSLAS
eukprot:Blabericola_migrator_1__5913@NODE_2993_length_2133_cov_4_566312_g1872_i0_p1_GENE_NODE_2993_length_2133_cov_4_566312_g1872_i0NODE_2993_length_2133_cov_4_566312_g1872_i0_p1_ORF_typecomplete_len211_score7_00DUF1494/PF07379_11/0_22_NODE_2993_length_2133_cov_4_566312_g1872_i04041036